MNTAGITYLFAISWSTQQIDFSLGVVANRFAPFFKNYFHDFRTP